MSIFERLQGRFINSVLLLVLVEGAVISHLSITTFAAKSFHVNEMVELRRSMAKYQHLLEHDNSGRHLLQGDDTRSEQSAEQNLNHVDEFQVVQSLQTEGPDHKNSKREQSAEEVLEDSNRAKSVEKGRVDSQRAKSVKKGRVDSQRAISAEKVREDLKRVKIHEDLNSKKSEILRQEAEQVTVDRPESKTKEQQQSKSEKEKVNEPTFQAPVQQLNPEPEEKNLVSESRLDSTNGEKQKHDPELDGKMVEELQLKTQNLDQRHAQELLHKNVEVQRSETEEQQKGEKQTVDVEVQGSETEEQQRGEKQTVDAEVQGSETEEQQRGEKQTVDAEVQASETEEQQSGEIQTVDAEVQGSETEEQQRGEIQTVDVEVQRSESEEQQRGEKQTVDAEVQGSETEEQLQQRGEEKTVDAEEKRRENEEPFVFPEPYLLGPTIKDWDKQRGDWLNANPHMKTTADGKPRVLIVTGSQPNPCLAPSGDYFHLKSLKLKIDYARMHNYEIYYSFAWLDPLFGSFWVKLPLVRKLILTHPEIEWFFWIDSDAVFTDMLFEAPFHTYEGYNMIMWGWEYGFYTTKSWTDFNAGVFILRNCQWSLDLIDKWSPMGPEGSVRVEYGKMLTAFLSDRENYPADDQSALAYLILTDEAVKAKVKLVELTEYMMSGWWIEVVDTYEECMEKYHPGLGDQRWPWITHFTGCNPCNGNHESDVNGKCIKNFDRAFNFADNQVLAYMGFAHQSLSSTWQEVLRTRNETDQPLDSVGVNPWKEKTAQVAAAVAEGTVS